MCVCMCLVMSLHIYVYIYGYCIEFNEESLKIHIVLVLNKNVQKPRFPKLVSSLSAWGLCSYLIPGTDLYTDSITIVKIGIL